MIHPHFSTRVAWILAASMSCSWAAVNFVAPSDGPVAFRRDRIPLDVETMATLSKQLELLTRSLPADSAINRRAAAQMLALATALDPGNRQAQELIHEFQLGTHEATPAGEAEEKARARIWQYIGWLETPEAGDQGKALAACLSDVMALADPKHPLAGGVKKGERGAWSGWIPPLSAYETESLAKTEEPGPSPAPEVPAAATGPEVVLTNAEVWTMLWESKPQMRGAMEKVPALWTFTCAPVALSVRNGPEPEAPFTISFTDANGGGLGATATSIQKLLQKKYGTLPKGLLEIDSPALRASIESGRRQSISAATAVLANAALSGKEPAAIVLGTVDADGNYALPTGFWEQLSALPLPASGPRRLVLPAAAADFLPSLLALEKPQFFMEYEVVLAANFQQLVDFSGKSPTGPFADAHAKFQEIQSKMGTLSVGTYVANPYIRRRLSDLTQEAPYHYSARMLSIQGAGSRPIDLPTSVLVPELRKAITPMLWFLQDHNSIELINRDAAGTVSKVNIAQEFLLQSYESSRSMVDALDRYVQKPDRDLYVKVKELLVAVRTFERTVRARTDSFTARAAVERAYLPVANALAEPGAKGAER